MHATVPYNVSRERAHPVRVYVYVPHAASHVALTLTMQTLSSHIQQFNLTVTVQV